jgi:porin
MTIDATLAPRLVAVTALALCSVTTAAQDAGAGSPVLGTTDVSTVGKIGRVHDNLRRATLWESLNQDLTGLYGDYARFKSRIKKDTGLSWSMDLSYLQQWGQPNGGIPSGQVLATPGLNWDIFDSKTFGEGSVQVASTLVRYPWRQTAGDVTDNLGLITPINDFPGNQNTFAQLTYTQAFPGNKLLVSIGQYPFYNFDGNQYLANQQQNFNSYIFAQNGTSTYPIAGLGAYAQINATSTIAFAAGFQNAADIAGDNLSTKGFGDGGFAWFGYAQWTPTFRGLGSAQYSVTYYEVPTVPAQPSSSGWSFNAVQNLNATWAVFGRANGAWGYVTPIRSSYALGGAMNNPLGRSATDQIALAFGYSDAAPPPTNPAGARNEKVVEVYWNWTFFRGLLFTPDLQYILNPALDPSRDSVWALSLRATLMF